jgi:DNA-binding MarR family transcriptional regulator
LSTQASSRSRLRATTPEQLAWVGLIRAHASTIRRFDSDLVSGHGLTLNDYEVLLHLARAPDRRLRRVDLAKSVLLTPSGITRLLVGLECEGYVERASCASDARVTYAQLTDKGYDKLREASKTHLEGIRSHFAARFSTEELETLRNLLERLPEGPEAAADCAAELLT